jgi:hypothetical protein
VVSAGFSVLFGPLASETVAGTKASRTTARAFFQPPPDLQSMKNLL